MPQPSVSSSPAHINATDQLVAAFAVKSKFRISVSGTAWYGCQGHKRTSTNRQTYRFSTSHSFSVDEGVMLLGCPVVLFACPVRSTSQILLPQYLMNGNKQYQCGWTNERTNKHGNGQPQNKMPLPTLSGGESIKTINKNQLMQRFVTLKLWQCSHYANVKYLMPVLHTNAFMQACLSQVTITYGRFTCAQKLTRWPA